jgi:hypothetical protein
MNSAERRKQKFLQTIKANNCSSNKELKELKDENKIITPRIHGKSRDIRNKNREKEFWAIARRNVARKQQQKERYEKVRITREKIERPWLYPIETDIDNKQVEPTQTPTSIPPLMYPKLIKIYLPKPSTPPMVLQKYDPRNVFYYNYTFDKEQRKDKDDKYKQQIKQFAELDKEIFQAGSERKRLNILEKYKKTKIPIDSKYEEDEEDYEEDLF